MLDTRLVGRTKPVDYRADMVWQKLPFDVSQVPAGGDGIPLLSPEAVSKVAEASVKMITVPFDLRQRPPAPLLDWQTLQTLDAENLPEGFAFLPDADAMHSQVLNDSSRHLLGETQEAWLARTLSESKNNSHWQLFGQQILTGKFLLPEISDIKVPNTGIPDDIVAALSMLGQLGIPMNTDAWDGYNAARQRYLALIKTLAPNAVSVAGDTHNAWAFELVPDGEQEPVAVEFATPAVSSPGMESYLATTDHEALATRIVDFNEHLRYLDTSQRGWMELTFSAEKCECQWQYVTTVKEKAYDVVSGPTMYVAHGSHRLQS
jgi:alkaline phosphatase D